MERSLLFLQRSYRQLVDFIQNALFGVIGEMLQRKSYLASVLFGISRIKLPGELLTPCRYAVNESVLASDSRSSSTRRAVSNGVLNSSVIFIHPLYFFSVRKHVAHADFLCSTYPSGKKCDL